MSALAALEIELRRDRAYARLTDTHSHRAIREDSLGILKGRDAITSAWVQQDAADIIITADLSEMIAYKVADWQGHRWVWREDSRIVREVVVENNTALKSAPPVHPPLGELRSGLGQYGATAKAILPAGFPEAARALADRLHSAWNGRAFDLYNRAWLIGLVRILPDATFYFEHAIIEKSQIALLWRVHGHHANGQRIRLIGSSIFTGDTDETIVDDAAMQAQISQKIIDYGAISN
jgi:hypothetical protein